MNVPPRAVVLTLGYAFKNVDLITEALTHRSYSHEKNLAFNNERLEFLGDTVLDLVMSHVLWEVFSDADEGTLSALRSQFVSESTLAAYAERLGMGDWLRLGKGEVRTGGRKRISTLADTFEALLGALYLDGGLSEAVRFLKFVFAAKIEQLKVEVSGQGRPKDPKSKLQEICQRAWGLAPIYECVSEVRDGPQRLFEMSLRIQGVELVRSRGASKKEATLLAAQDVLRVSDGKIEVIKNLLEQKQTAPAGAEERL